VIPTVKLRGVVDMGMLSNHKIKLRMRYHRLLEWLKGLRRGKKLGKSDFQGGYYHLPLGKEAKWYTGIAVKMKDGTTRYYVYLRLPMGAAASPFIFCLYSSEIMRILKIRLQRKGIIVALSGLIDDIFFYGDEADVSRTLEELKALCAQIGATLSVEKTLGPCGEAVVLGVVVNTDNMTLSLPVEKLIRTLIGVRIFQGAIARKWRVPHVSLAQLGGRVVWLGNVDDETPSHTGALCVWTKFGHGRWRAWSHDHHTWGSGHDLCAYSKALDWLWAKAEGGTLASTKMVDPQDPRWGRRVLFAVDATGGPTPGLGIVSELSALRITFEGWEGVHRPDILPVLEFLTPLIIMVEYGDILEEYGCHMSVASDALGVCFWAMGRKSHREEANDIAKLQAAHTKNTNVWYVQRWLSRWFNWKSDRTASTQSVEDLRAAGVHLPMYGATLTLKGPPEVFLKGFAEKVYPGFKFSKAWK
jgi:hypothetical protein